MATLDDVRRLALALPQAEEKPSYNDTAGFRAGGGRLFAREREDGESIALRVDELEELLTDAWRSVAPKRLVARFDADQPPA